MNAPSAQAGSSSEEAGARSIAGDESASGSLQVGRFVALLPAAAYQLNELESRLRASGTYMPVAHAAWSQTASSWGTRAGFPVARLGIDVPGLSGNVYLEHGQFLHLGLSLTWAMESPADGLKAAPGTAFTLNETRRVRFYERNYYDHPAFGVIALVTPAQGPRAPGRAPGRVTPASRRFAALPPAARHAWLASHLAALRAGRIPLAQLP